MTTRKKAAGLPIHEVRTNLADIATAAKEHDVVTLITRHGKPLAQLGPITCGHCGAVIRPTASGTNWVDAEGWDYCDGTSTSHEPGDPR